MPRLTPVNAEFETALAPFQAAQGLVAGLWSALAVAPGDALTPEEYPLYGFYLRSTAEQLVAYFITPGRFIRYEVAGGQALTITVPIERIRRVAERSGARSITVTVEIDADTAVAVTEAEYMERPDPDSMDDDMRGVARAVTRTQATVYDIVVELPDNPGPNDQTRADMARLVEFSRALRATVGL